LFFLEFKNTLTIEGSMVFCKKSDLKQFYLGHFKKILYGDASLQQLFLFNPNIRHSIYRGLYERDSFINWTFNK